MCDIHLIESLRFEGTALAGVQCCCCGGPIQGKAVHVQGQLDDGSPGQYRFAYHPDRA